MGAPYQKTPNADGDEPTISPSSLVPGILGSNTAGATRRILVDDLGRLQVVAVNDTESAVSSIISRGTATTVPSGTLTTVLTYTNSTGNNVWFDLWVGTGTADAQFFLVIDTATKIEVRTSEQDRTVLFKFPVSFLLPNGSVVDIKVIHEHSATADFSASFIGHI